MSITYYIIYKHKSRKLFEPTFYAHVIQLTILTHDIIDANKNSSRKFGHKIVLKIVRPYHSAVVYCVYHLYNP